MKKRVHRAFPVWSYQKEEDWLNEMAEQGWLLNDAGFLRYDFVSTPPGSHQIRMQLLKEWHSHQNSHDYIQFVEDTGAERVATYGRWVYFKKEADGRKFELFSDTASRKKHLRSVQLLLLPFVIVMVLNFLNTGLLTDNKPATKAIAVFTMFLLFVLLYGLIKLELKVRELDKTMQYTE